MVVSRRELAGKRELDKRIEAALIADLEALWARVAGWDPVAIGNALVELVPEIIDRYGAAYAEVAAQWFEHTVQAVPVVAGEYRREAWERSVRYALKPYVAGEVALGVVKSRLAASALRHARQGGRDTIDASCRATSGVLYARMLTGAENCDFCVVMASRGPVYGSAHDAGGYANRYHDDCDCEVVPVRGQWVPDSDSPMGARWEGENPGYDFEQLYIDEYKPYWRSGLSMKEVLQRRRDTRAAEPWGGITWLEDLKDSTAPIPTWWDRKARYKTFDGIIESRNGKTIYRGGHRFGRKWPGKTEFPEQWDDETIDLVLAETWAKPTAVRIRGDRREARRVFDGVLIEVTAYGDDYSTFRSYHPIGGRDVFYNKEDGTRSQKRIPRSADKWEIIHD